jgi:hypothetical protein
MPYPITRGYGDQGDAFPATLVVTRGFSSAIASPLFIEVAYGLEARLVEVVFSEPVVDADALNPANYGITGGGGLDVFSVIKMTNSIFRLTTSKQTPATVYTLTASNIFSLDGDLI